MPLISLCDTTPIIPICDFTNCAEFGNIQTRPNNSSTPQVVTNAVTGNLIHLAQLAPFGIPLTNGNIRIPHSSVSEFVIPASFLVFNAMQFTIVISVQNGVTMNTVLNASFGVARRSLVRVRQQFILDEWSITPFSLPEFPT